MTPVSNESTNLQILVYFINISNILWSITRTDSGNYSNIEGCEENISSCMTTIDHLVAEEEEHLVRAPSVIRKMNHVKRTCDL